MANKFRSLVVSGDDEFRAELVERALGLNFSVQDIRSADELPAVLRKYSFDWLFLDLGLGADQCRQIIDMLAAGRRPRTILVGAQDAAIVDAIRRTAVRSGVDVIGGLPKPLTSSALLTLMSRLGTTASAAFETGLAARQLDAIPDGEILVDYQPIVSLGDRTVGRVEALVRWQHPRYGLIGPGRFISIIERSGAIVPLTWEVLSKALDQHLAWRNQGTTLAVSVNVSALVLASLQVADDVLDLIRARGCSPRHLALEITETERAPDPAVARTVLVKLREAGVAIAMDDYGVGFSNLERLRYYPFTELKIDRGVVADLGTGPEARQTVAMLVALADREKLRVTGEGIESSDQWDMLEELGCDFGQGFLIARPMRGDQVVRWIDTMAKAGRYRPPSES